MKTVKITMMSLVLVGTLSFAYAKMKVEDTFTACTPKEGGPGLCVRNMSEGGFKCEPRDYLGDCSGTKQVIIPD